MRDVALVTGTRKGIGRHLVDHFLHKGYADVSMLAREHPGGFWQALARYLFRNLAG